MRIDEQPDAILRGLREAGVEFVVVGGMVAVLQKAPVTGHPTGRRGWRRGGKAD